MRESIRGYADAIIEDAAPDGIGALCDELRGVQLLLERSEDLRLILADPGTPAHARRGILTDLLGTHLAPGTLRLVTFTAEVDRATEFTEDVVWLSARAAAERDHLVPANSGPLGRVAATERLDGYASAILVDLRGEARLNDVEDELFRFSRVIAGAEQLRFALTDGDVPAEARRQLVLDLIGAKASETSTRLASYATQIGRPRDYVELLDAVIERVAEENDRRIAEVRAPIELTEEQERRLRAALARIIGNDVDVRVIVDPDVLGGFVATVGDSVVDGTVRHRLEVLRERLVLPEANVTT